MQYIVLGLGNPGEEYRNSRHNAGKNSVEFFANSNNFSEFKSKTVGRSKLLEAKGKIGKDNISAVLPEVFMNLNGKILLPYIKSVKAAERLVVVYDDIDLPLGKIKISFNRGTGGHKGLESVTKTIKTKDFVRVRIGVSKMGTKGAVKKPVGEDDVVKFLLGKFSPSEQEKLKSIQDTISDSIKMIISEGRERAMTEFN